MGVHAGTQLRREKCIGHPSNQEEDEKIKEKNIDPVGIIFLDVVPPPDNLQCFSFPLSLTTEKTHAGELVEAAKEFVEQPDELLRRALRRQHRESHDIGEEDAARKEGGK